MVQKEKKQFYADMKLRGGPASVQIKIALIIIALFIGVGTIWYTNQLVTKLELKEKEIVNLYAKGLTHLSNSSEGSDLTFLFENIIRPIDFPMILTNSRDSLEVYDSTVIRNIYIDPKLSKQELISKFSTILKEMDAAHTPLDVKIVPYKDTLVIQRIHYDESTLIKQLKYYPYFQLTLAFFFLLIGYISFSQIKRSEQSNIWVGMAKETAHQFGTPLSSLLGWIELLKNNYNDPDKALDITYEIQNDVERLNRITNRFSKIGSKPELKELSVVDVIQKVIDYFERRLPQTGKRVKLELTGDNSLKALISPELFEWVIENLIKNALDAIEHSEGQINFVITETKTKVEIEASDNGKGIDLNRRKDVFRPGYSTKRRGWGLGLSLSKRIVEEYHSGKIYVKHSALGSGTVFKIILPKSTH